MTDSRRTRGAGRRLRGSPAMSAWLIAGGLVAFIAAFATGCGSSGGGTSTSSTAGMLQKVGKGEGQVNLIEWPGCRDGQRERRSGEPFEKKTGCQVSVKDAGTSDEMIQLMRTGQYDGVSASGNATRAWSRAATSPRSTPTWCRTTRRCSRTSRTSPTTRSTASTTGSRTVAGRTC